MSIHTTTHVVVAAVEILKLKEASESQPPALPLAAEQGVVIDSVELGVIEEEDRVGIIAQGKVAAFKLRIAQDIANARRNV